jgi:nitrogen regulatory protein P-II 2
MALTTPMKKISIILERVLKDDIIDLIKKNGAKGWTLIEVNGEGSRGMRASEFEGRNFQIDTIVNAECADRILQELSASYISHWSLVVYLSDIQILRAEKYQ